jgi:hypothetical protein
MKRLSVLLVVLALVTFIVSAASAGPKETCVTIQSGTLIDSYGDPLVLGFTKWGYNYQSQMFNGKYCDSYHNATWCQPYKDVDLMMKWNDAWLSNKDCNGDGKLDRYFGYSSYVGSGAWLTNHQSGTYEQDGKTCNWSDFVKIVAAPADAYAAPPVDPVYGELTYYAANGKVIGPQIWGQFIVIQEVYNDECAGQHGLLFKSPSPGLGAFKP